jgi:alpha-amylase
MQQASLRRIYEIESMVMKSGDSSLISDWRKAQTSDHFYYMCTKWFNDGDVHKYFNPYDSPYESFIAFTNVINDMMIRLKEKDKSIMGGLIHESATG